MKTTTPICPYCRKPARLIRTEQHYGPRHAYGFMWRCEPCDAHVGCHKNSEDHAPLGRLANKPLRQARQRAHAAFDPLWKLAMARRGWSKAKAKDHAYEWLADAMGLTLKKCHIAKFKESQCQDVIEICAPYNWKKR